MQEALRPHHPVLELLEICEIISSSYLPSQQRLCKRWPSVSQRFHYISNQIGAACSIFDPYQTVIGSADQPCVATCELEHSRKQQAQRTTVSHRSACRLIIGNASGPEVQSFRISPLRLRQANANGTDKLTQNNLKVIRNDCGR